MEAFCRKPLRQPAGISRRQSAQELVNKTTAIRDLGTAAVSEAEAGGRGVGASKISLRTERKINPDCQIFDLANPKQLFGRR